MTGFSEFHNATREVHGIQTYLLSHQDMTLRSAQLFVWNHLRHDSLNTSSDLFPGDAHPICHRIIPWVLFLKSYHNDDSVDVPNSEGIIQYTVNLVNTFLVVETGWP